MTLPSAPDEAEVVAPDGWSAAVAAAKEVGFGWFDWLSVVDGDDETLTVVLHLWDRVGHRSRFLRTTVVGATGSVASVADVFPGAGWHEREAAEMFGLRFDGAPDPRPLLLPDGFVGHPLRKDFPLAARGLGEWPGAHEPAEHGPAARPPGRRRPTATGVPDWTAPEQQPEKSPDQPTDQQPSQEQS